MALTRVIPVLLIYDGGLNKTRGFQPWKYVGDPANAVRIYNEKQVDEIAILDVRATLEGRAPDLKLIGEIAGEAFMPLAYGGGVRTVDQMQAIFSCGVEKVVMSSVLHEDMGVLSAGARQFGVQSMVASVDVRRRNGRPTVWSRSGTRDSGIDPVTFCRRAAEAGAGEIFLNDVDRDGTKAGYDLELIEAVSTAVSVPVVPCGGASSLEDLREAVRRGASAVAAGSLFVLIGRRDAVLITYPDPAELRTAVGSS